MVAPKLSERGGKDETLVVLDHLLSLAYSSAVSNQKAGDAESISERSKYDDTNIELDALIENFSPESQIVIRTIFVKGRAFLKDVFGKNQITESLRRRKEELPDPEKQPDAEVNRKKRQISLRIDPNLIPIVNLAAQTNDMDRNNWIMRACVREAVKNGLKIPPEFMYLLDE